MAVTVALEELFEHAGAQFDPLVVDALATVIRRTPL
jgi:HD-GYP domain-containing protein (c-di-GMP phosphodiesterase class II)